MTYTARLNAKINGAARIRLLSLDLIEADQLAMIQAKMALIRAKAAAYAANHPAPRATFH